MVERDLVDIMDEQEQIWSRAKGTDFELDEYDDSPVTIWPTDIKDLLGD